MNKTRYFTAENVIIKRNMAKIILQQPQFIKEKPTGIEGQDSTLISEFYLKICCKLDQVLLRMKRLP